MVEVEMGWRYISYCDGEEKLVFVVEPMFGTEDIVYLPNEETWNKNVPQWAKENRETIIENIKEIKWNRNLKWIEDENADVFSMSKEENTSFEGTLEGTKAGQDLINLNLFNSNSLLPAEKVHELWCVLERKFAEQAEGEVSIYSNEIILNSVFQAITLKALIENTKVVLNIMEN